MWQAVVPVNSQYYRNLYLGNDEVEYTAYYPYTGNENISAGVLDLRLLMKQVSM